MTVSDPPLTSCFNTVLVEIAAPMQLVWDLFLDRSLWMESFVSEQWIGAERGVGALKSVVIQGGGGEVERFEQYLVADPPHRLVVRLWVPGSSAMGHADFLLEPRPAGCTFRASIHTMLPGAENSDAMASATQAKIEQDFAQLGKLAQASV